MCCLWWKKSHHFCLFIIKLSSNGFFAQNALVCRFKIKWLSLKAHYLLQKHWHYLPSLGIKRFFSRSLSALRWTRFLLLGFRKSLISTDRAVKNYWLSFMDLWKQNFSLQTWTLLFNHWCHFQEWTLPDRTHSLIWYSWGIHYANLQFSWTCAELHIDGIYHVYAGSFTWLSEVRSICWIWCGTLMRKKESKRNLRRI